MCFARAMDVIINPDGSCGNGWVCEHRWNPISKMVRFRNAVAGTQMENYWNNGGAVAFSRGNKGFFAMAKEGSMDQTLATGRIKVPYLTLRLFVKPIPLPGLPAGTYCNIIDDCKTSVTVGSDGRARIQINNYEEPILAICVGCDSSSPPVESESILDHSFCYFGITVAVFYSCSYDAEWFRRRWYNNLYRASFRDEPHSDFHSEADGMMQTTYKYEFQHSFINNYLQSTGQDLFIRGGIDHSQRPGCVENAATSDCAIPIDVKCNHLMILSINNT